MVVRSTKTMKADASLAIASALEDFFPALSKLRIAFSPIHLPDDLDFLFQVYASTREMELSQVSWSARQKADFLLMQFHAQHTYYQEHYSDAEFLKLCQGSFPVGRLYITRWEDEFRIIDIALLSSARNQGIGSAVLSAILSLAQQERLAVRIHVEHFNPAMRLYRRLGFHQTGSTGVYHLLEWLPAGDRPVLRSEEVLPEEQAHVRAIFGRNSHGGV